MRKPPRSPTVSRSPRETKSRGRRTKCSGGGG